MQIFIGLFSLFFFCGCQSFYYHDPQKPYRGKSQFYNNYQNGPKPSFWKWQWERWTTPKKEEDLFKTEVVISDGSTVRQEGAMPRFTWLGHASILLQIDGLNILMDPVFSERASPFSFLGPKRQSALPFEIHQLPEIHCVLISHAHYDHLDLPSIKTLAKRFPQAQFLVPLGLQKKVQNEGAKQTAELDWWESFPLGKVEITFTPAQHWSQRTLWDRNQTLWGGWHLRGTQKTVLYTGDTGYSKDFLDIQQRLGGVDLAFIPIGAYKPRWFMSQQHVDPAEAVQIHLDLKAKKSIGVHWGTFLLADESIGEPPRDLKSALQEKNINADAFSTVRIGETIEF